MVGTNMWKVKQKIQVSEEHAEEPGQAGGRVHSPWAAAMDPSAPTPQPHLKK